MVGYPWRLRAPTFTWRGAQLWLYASAIVNRTVSIFFRFVLRKQATCKLSF